MAALAIFDYPTFIARYPEFSSVTSTLAQAYFNEATLYLANDGSGPVTDPVQQLTLLNMLTAHIAALNSGVNGQTPSGIVGRISSASEGSVSVSSDMGGVPGTAAWFVQTKYGFNYWQATASFRTFRYVAGNPTPTQLPYPWYR